MDYDKLGGQETYNLLSDEVARKNTRSALEMQRFRRLHVLISEIPELPSGCTVEVLRVGHKTLKFGDLVCGKSGRNTVFGRFLGVHGELMELSVGNRKCTVHLRDSLGKITRAEFKGRQFDPAYQSGFARLISRLTRYGTLFR